MLGLGHASRSRRRGCVARSRTRAAWLALLGLIGMELQLLRKGQVGRRLTTLVGIELQLLRKGQVGHG